MSQFWVSQASTCSITSDASAVWLQHTTKHGTLSARCATHLLVIAIFQQVLDPEPDPCPSGAPGLAPLQHWLVVQESAVKDRAILKNEDASAMLLLQLPLALIPGSSGIVQSPIAMPLSVLEFSFIPACRTSAVLSIAKVMKSNICVS